ncbi:energy transducer TonB [Aquimarina rhabdastrellae]
MSNKHEANVRKSPMINFQIGLIASLLFTYVMFEVWTSEPIRVNEKALQEDIFEDEFPMSVFRIEPELKPVAVVKPKPKPVPSFVEPKIVEDDTVIDNPKDEFKNEVPDELPIEPTDIIDGPIDEGFPEEVPFIAVEFVPIYPGCEGLASNKERATCFSDKIKRMVSKKFNGDLGADLGLSGLQRIYVQFDVESDGTIQNVKARGPHKALEKEAIRVVKMLPTMTPGKQRDTPVRVKYSLPIAFTILD